MSEKPPLKLKHGIGIVRREGHLAYTSSGYVFDRRVFWSVSLIALLLCGIAIWQNGFGDHLQASCPQDTPLPGCLNPFYQNCQSATCMSLRDEKYFYPGFTYGEEPTWLFRNAGVLVSGLFILGVVVNHLVHNRGRIVVE